MKKRLPEADIRKKNRATDFSEKRKEDQSFAKGRSIFMGGHRSIQGVEKKAKNALSLGTQPV